MCANKDELSKMRGKRAGEPPGKAIRKVKPVDILPLLKF
jgi:hypothetical protein